jgi:hypothetical protein
MVSKYFNAITITIIIIIIIIMEVSTDFIVMRIIIIIVIYITNQALDCILNQDYYYILIYSLTLIKYNY